MKYFTYTMTMIMTFSISAFAQTGGPYDLSWNTVDGGGGTVTGGSFSLSFTTGQADAGQQTGGTFQLNSGYWPGTSSTSTAPQTPVVASAPHDMTKDRYLSFDPSVNAGQLTAIRVTRAGSATPWYVSCSLQDIGTDGKLSTLVQTVEFCDWTDSVIHVRGCEVVPGNEYLVEATLDDATYSATLSVFTTAPQFGASRQFGDLVGGLEDGEWTAPDGLVTATDIVSAVQKFQLVTTAPHLSRIDGDGQIPNGIVSGSDILREVIAFTGGDFGFGVTGCLTGTCVPSCP